MEKMDLLVFFD